MYIDQLSDSSTVYVSDLEEVNNDLCHRLNQMVWNIENGSYCCQSSTLSVGIFKMSLPETGKMQMVVSFVPSTVAGDCYDRVNLPIN